MKIIVFSDLHDDFDVLKKLKGKKNLFFLGDLYTQKEFVRIIGNNLIEFYDKKINMDDLNKIFRKHEKELNKSITENNNIPDFFKENKINIVVGNHEIIKFYRKLTRLSNINDLHLKKKTIDNIKFIGHGGMILPEKVPVKRLYIYTPEEVIENIKRLKPDKDSVIIMHELPIGEYHKKIRKYFEKIKPRLVIGGHHHKLSMKTFNINNIKYLASGMKGDFRIINI